MKRSAAAGTRPPAAHATRHTPSHRTWPLGVPLPSGSGPRRPAVRTHADAVLARLDHSDARVREWAIAAFGQLASALDPTHAAAVAPRAAVALEARLQDEDRRVRERAAALRARMQGDANGAGHGAGRGGSGTGA
jgi:hypothetical protein